MQPAEVGGKFLALPFITFITLLKGVSHCGSAVDPWDELALEAQDLSSILCREGKTGPFRNLERILTRDLR
jgi:hypothetical protein